MSIIKLSQWGEICTPMFTDTGIDLIIKATLLQIMQDHVLGRGRHFECRNILEINPVQLPFRTGQLAILPQAGKEMRPAGSL